MASHPATKVPPPAHSIGHWLPKNRSLVKQWLAGKLQQLESRKAILLDPSIQAFKDAVHSTQYLNILATRMFTEIPPAYVNDPVGRPQVESFDKMCDLVNMIIKEGPQWYYTETPSTAMGLIGFPINAILDWPMGTNAGYQFFLNHEVNQHWAAILGVWGKFLAGKDSQICLSEESGWLSPTALTELAEKGNDGKTNYTFQELYECDPTKPYYDFPTWDAFFTRQFRPKVRPIAFPDNEKSPDLADSTMVIINACESGPLQYAQNVKLNDQFWLKSQPYSFANMLDNHPLTPSFVGGSVYQAFLSALSYHCWHAPVSGKVADIRIVPGTYYSENLYQGFANPDGPDPAAANNSQPYISAVATRGIIFIEADNPYIGMMGIVFIGMAEVSSCEFKVKPGDRITKGQLIGMFHFGGSTHCMVFRPQTNIKFVVPPEEWDPNGPNNAVNSALAFALGPAT